VPGNFSLEDLQLAIEHDKKARDGEIKFVCVDEIGRVSFEMMPSRSIAEMARSVDDVR
jgi:3-dehydroquinate synthetase